MKTLLTFILISVFYFTSNSQSSETVYEEFIMDVNLNNPSTADAYSWLSKDGLRIYFTRDNSTDEIWKAERKNINEEFNNPETININGIKGNSEVFSCWLTNDEKTLFFITRERQGGFSTSLYKAHFDENLKSFINPIKINLIVPGISESNDIFISGPSLTDDLSQLFVYYNDTHSNEHIAFFKSDDELNYTFHSFINKANNYCPGNLSNNGLNYYLTLRNEDKILVKLSRTTLSSEFGLPEYIVVDANLNNEKNYYQPFVNTELGIISITIGSGTWESNDLEIMKLPSNDLFTNYLLENDSIKLAIVQNFENPILETLIENKPVTDTLNSTNYLWVFENFKIVDTTTNLYLKDLIDDKTIFIKNADTLTIKGALTFDINTVKKTSPLIASLEEIYLKGIPNPASSLFTIQYDFKTNLDKKPLLEIFNSNGKIIKQIELEHALGFKEIDINDMAEGIYFYIIHTTQFLGKPQKFIIKRT